LVLRTVSLGGRPWQVGFDAAANRIYVSDFDRHAVMVLDGAGDTVVATVPVGGYPASLCVSPTTHRVYVIDGASGALSVVGGR